LGLLGGPAHRPITGPEPSRGVTVTGTPPIRVPSRSVGSSSGAARRLPPALATPVTSPSSSTIQPIRVRPPRTDARPSYSPAGASTCWAANGSSSSPTVTVPRVAASVTVAVIPGAPPAAFSVRSSPVRAPSYQVSIFLPSHTYATALPSLTA